jgi:hypothetical protein
MFSSSKGRLPQSSAYRMTPHDHTSTSGPAYSLPLMTLQEEGVRRAQGVRVLNGDAGGSDVRFGRGVEACGPGFWRCFRFS